ncbi:LPS translocon maturation chaperone LptM [Pasteurella multocida]|nr:lipoprotein [Pasteurella multocida]URI04241.1 lipoprotein [Pasteurella multocida]
MKKWVSIFLLGIVCALSVACGVKGPLYFPENEKYKKHNNSR